MVSHFNKNKNRFTSVTNLLFWFCVQDNIMGDVDKHSVLSLEINNAKL